MATRAQLEKYAQNPRVRKFLDLIAHTEGTEGNGYRTAFGGGRLSSLDDHPRYLKTFKQKNGKENKTSAAGRYQFLRGTWDGLARQYGLKDFGPQSQDIAAVALLAQNGALGRILKGDMQGAVRKSGATWASLPTAPASYSQPTKSWRAVNRFLGSKGVSDAPQQQAPQPLGTDWNAFKNKIEGNTQRQAPKPLGTNWEVFKASIDGEQAIANPEPLGTDWEAFKSSVEGQNEVAGVQPLGNNWEAFKQSLEAKEPMLSNTDSQNIMGDNYGGRI